MTLALGVTVKVFLSKWTFSDTISPKELNLTLGQYAGTPWYLPDGCQDEPAEQDKGSLLGPGVTKVDDSTIGGVDQWGHVDGFVPGQKTWVLSTGKITDALGTPEQFASTDLGRDGDSGLSTLAGYPTYDAASYTVTLKPTGSTLHVKYVFASEEYPEYVGSTFNDVMAITVNGHNCATVPDTDIPVAVNTVNAQTNSNYYVDNTSGAAGYSTSMDGLTVPLTCSIPVTPGQPATVQIAVADTSDHIYDSGRPRRRRHLDRLNCDYGLAGIEPASPQPRSTCVTDVEGSLMQEELLDAVLRKRCELAPRSRPAGAGFKPPTAALAEDCRGERVGEEETSRVARSRRRRRRSYSA
jgi:hypothetical protein